MNDFKSVVLYNEDRTKNLKVWYVGFTKEQITEDIRKRFTKSKSIWVQFKYLGEDS